MWERRVTFEVEIALLPEAGLPHALGVQLPPEIALDEGGKVLIDERDGVPPSALLEAVRPELPEGTEIITNSRDEIWVCHPDGEVLRTLDGRRWRVRYVSRETINDAGDIVGVEEGAVLLE